MSKGACKSVSVTKKLIIYFNDIINYILFKNDGLHIYILYETQ